MTTTPSMRKQSAITLVVVFLLGTLAAFAPAAFASRSARAFCGGLAPGMTVSELQERAEAARYTSSKVREGVWMVEHPSSLGRAYCVVRFDASGRLTSKTPGE